MADAAIALILRVLFYYARRVIIYERCLQDTRFYILHLASLRC